MFHNNRKNSDDSPDQDDSRLDWRTLRIGKIYWYLLVLLQGQWMSMSSRMRRMNPSGFCLRLFGNDLTTVCLQLLQNPKKKHHENWELPEKIRRIAINIMVGSPARWKNHLVLPALSKKMGTIPWISKMSQTCRI